MSERDLFANFERMRREMDELFGDVFGTGVLGSRHRGGFSPAVEDVAEQLVHLAAHALEVGEEVALGH